MRLAFLPLVVALSHLATAQQATPAPQQNPQPQTIRTGTQIVILDVNVTSGGKPVHHLKPSDFTVLENGTPQPVSRFEEHTAPASGGQLPHMPRMEPGIYTNFSLVPEDGPLNVLLIDTLNTPVQSQMMARQKIMAFLQSMKPMQRVAVFGLSSRLFLLQGFTSDPALLQAAVSGKHGNAKSSPLLADPTEESVSDQMADVFGNSPDAAQVIANLQQFEAEISTEQLRNRVLATLSSLNQLARYLSGLPGRKNLIWMSGSFPLNVLPNGDLPNPFSATLSMEDQFRETTNLLTRAQVAVYPIDARGLQLAPMLDASVSGSKYGRNPTAYGKDLQKFSTDTINEHSTMIEMAEATGGTPFVNTNDLNGAINAALSAGSDYYTLVYSPTNRNWNGTYRKINVKVNGTLLTLNYRRGYYADDPYKSRGSTAATSTAADTADPFTAAMSRGAPNPTQIIFKALITRDPKGDENLSDGNVPAPKTKGPYRNFNIFIAADPGDLEFRSLAEGNRASAIRFSTVVYNRDGQPVNLLTRATRANITPANYEQMLKTGASYEEQVSVPVKGEYFLRIGVEDLFSGKIGTIEVPVDSVPPLKK